MSIGVVGRPELLLLDEPTNGADPEARRQFCELIRRLREDGTTILLTTHYLEEAEALADRVAVLTRGCVLEVATWATLGGRGDAQAIAGDRGADAITALLRRGVDHAPRRRPSSGRSHRTVAVTEAIARGILPSPRRRPR